jgi:hypothetical protein
VWPATLVWAVTFAALCVSATRLPRRAAAVRAVSGRLHSGQRPRRSHAGHPAGMQRYTFEALVTIPMPDGSPSALVPGPDWHGVIRARTEEDSGSPGLYSALVDNWDQHDSGRAGAARALARIVAFGPQPAERLPVGGTFVLWRGRDVAHGVVTRRIFL